MLCPACVAWGSFLTSQRSRKRLPTWPSHWHGHQCPTGRQWLAPVPQPPASAKAGQRGRPAQKQALKPRAEATSSPPALLSPYSLCTLEYTYIETILKLKGTSRSNQGRMRYSSSLVGHLTKWLWIVHFFMCSCNPISCKLWVTIILGSAAWYLVYSFMSDAFWQVF